MLYALIGGCLLCLFLCVTVLNNIHRVLLQLYLNYRKVNQMDEREEMEGEANRF